MSKKIKVGKGLRQGDPMSSVIDFENPTKGELRALSGALDLVTESIEIMDSEGLLCYVNHAFQEATGYMGSEAIGRSATALLATETQNTELFDAIWDTLREGNAWHGEFEGRRRDGETYRQIVNITPLHEDGKLVYAVALKTPIDELAVAQERLKTANEHLVSTGSMAVVGQLAAAMGHEINNPAQVVRSCLEHLAEQSGAISTAELGEVVSDALTALRRIETVAAELTPFSSTDTEEMHQVDVNGCVRHALRLANNELRHRTKIAEALHDVPPVDGLEGRIVQLITGLLVFVARAMVEDQGGNRLRVTTRFDEGSTCIQIDCKLGAPTSSFEELQTRVGLWEGSGAGGVDAGMSSAFVHGSSKWIGFIFCQQIAVAHGGSIEVSTSKDQRSASIEICLPASEHADVAVVNVLVIDDEELILRSLGRMLRREYLVDVCSGGEPALEMIADGDYDVILCDIMMPGLSGVALYERLAKVCPEARARIIFISAGTFTAKTQAFADGTSQPVLLKPVRRDELRAAIESLLRSSRQGN
ncbi:MAG: response regulator [Myxococcales bacterium]|nr:response regulator [Myxococcales bacterium]